MENQGREPGNRGQESAPEPGRNDGPSAVRSVSPLTQPDTPGLLANGPGGWTVHEVPSRSWAGTVLVVKNEGRGVYVCSCRGYLTYRRLKEHPCYHGGDLRSAELNPEASSRWKLLHQEKRLSKRELEDIAKRAAKVVFG